MKTIINTISTLRSFLLELSSECDKFEKMFFLYICRLVKIKEWIDKNDPGATVIPFSGAFELKVI